jgi:hypothetical protein
MMNDRFTNFLQWTTSILVFLTGLFLFVYVSYHFLRYLFHQPS